MNRLRANIDLWIVLFVIFLDWMGLGLVYPMFSSMLFDPKSPIACPEMHCNMRGWYLGILLSAMPIAQFFSGPILGTLSDQKGRRPLFLFSLGLTVFGYLISISAVTLASISILILSRVIVGIGGGNSAVVSAAIADLSTNENKAKNFGLYSMACGVGFTVGPFLGGKFSEIDFSLPFIIAGIATFLNYLLILFLFKETHKTPKKGTIRYVEGIHNLIKAFKMKGLRAVFLTVLIFCFGWSFFYEFIPVTWIADYHLNSASVGFFYAYGAFFYALSSGLLIRPIVSRFKNQNILFCALLILGTLILTLLSSPKLLFVWFYLPVVNFLVSLLFPTSTTMVSDFASKETQGETLGILQSIQSAAFAFSPLAAGSLLGTNPHMPMLVGGIAMLFAALMLGILLKKELFN